MNELYYKAIADDEAWHALLQKQFGKMAGTMRYTKRGHGEPGTALRAAFEAFQDSTTAWLQYMREHRS